MGALTAGFISRKNLLGRGWTHEKIEHFLGGPERKDARRYPNKPTFWVSLYDAERVVAAENTYEWQTFYKRRREERTQSRDNAIDRARNFDVRVRGTDLPLESIIAMALDNWNDFNQCRCARTGKTFHPATQTAGAEFIVRITLNYVRHNLTNYDQALENLGMGGGTLKEYLALRARFFDMMRRHFPVLAEALAQQERQDELSDLRDYQRRLPQRAIA